MSDFKNIVEFFRLNRRSDEAEAKQIPENNILLRDIQNNTDYNVDIKIFETDHTKYKRIFQVLEDYDAKFIYVHETLSEVEYFVKTSLGKYRNIINNNLEIFSSDELIEIPIDNPSSYIYNSELKRVFVAFESINGVIIFPDTINYDPKSKYLNEITNSTYTYDYKDPLTTYGKIMEFILAHFKNFIRNAVKKVIVAKSEIPAIINLIPFLQFEYGFGNYILKYKYYDINHKQKFFVPDGESAITLKFLSPGGMLSFLNETLFSQGFSIEQDAYKSPVRNFFRNQFIEQIIYKTEEDFLSRGKEVYYSVMETLFFLPEEITAKFSDRFFWLLLELMVNRDNFQNTKDLAEENIFVKIIRIILQKENQEAKLMSWFLETIKEGDKTITKFEFIYDRINGDNFIEFVKLVNKAWKKSRFIYPDIETNTEFTTTDGLLFLPYSSQKAFGFYFSNISMSFETDNQKGRLLKTLYGTGKYTEELKPDLKTDKLVKTKVEIIEQYWYHPFYPVYLEDIEKQETELKLDSVVPAFMLKANRDKQFWSNVITTAEYAADILITVSGVGNIAKFRYLAKFAAKASSLRFVTKAGRAVATARKTVAATAGVVEITSGVVNTLLKLTGAKDANWGKSLSEYLFWLELLSLSGELTVAINNGLRKSAKEIVGTSESKNQFEKQLDNLIEEGQVTRKEVDDLLEHLDELAEVERKLGDFVIHGQDDISEAFIKNIVKQVRESTGLKNFDINLVDRNNEKYQKLFEQWQKGGGYGFFKPTSGEFGLKLYKGLSGEGPQIYMFAGRVIDGLGRIRNVSFTKYTAQHELFHVEMFMYLKNKTPNYMKYWKEIPTYMHEQYVLNRLLKTKNWKKEDLVSDLENINKIRKTEAGLPKIELDDLKNWKFEIELEKIGIKIQ
ncbi:hypothetical protein AB4Y90_01420 [Chryseobacterium sp. 2TAF14]|uniref:hypothetical protein n=1 Tax=Chryseobacterium sp. 2TAF14 TaxID=3233007 RepID=UPI003F914CDC